MTPRFQPWGLLRPMASGERAVYLRLGLRRRIDDIVSTRTAFSGSFRYLRNAVKVPANSFLSGLHCANANPNMTADSVLEILRLSISCYFRQKHSQIGSPLSGAVEPCYPPLHTALIIDA